jgi:hypothetical protein
MVRDVATPNVPDQRPPTSEARRVPAGDAGGRSVASGGWAPSSLLFAWTFEDTRRDIVLCRGELRLTWNERKATSVTARKSAVWVTDQRAVLIVELARDVTASWRNVIG